MNKKRLIIYFAIAAVYMASMVYKAKIIENKNSAEKVTIASIWQEKGIPVHVTTIKSGIVPKYMKATIKVVDEKKVEITLPASVRPFMPDKVSGDVYIEGRRFSGRRGVISPESLDYTGFLSMKAFLERKLPWKKGTLKIGRIPYYDGKKYSFVPSGAIYTDTKGSWIYSVKSRVLRKKSVSVLFSNHINSAIDGEFAVGETVVVSDQRDLSSGLQVNPIEL